MKHNKIPPSPSNEPVLLPNHTASRILDLELDYDSKSLTKENLL